MPHRQILTERAPAGRSATARWRKACVAALGAALLVAGCDNLPSLVPPAGAMAVARLEPRNGSTARGTIAFTQRGNRVWINANLVELWPGAHSVYIHEVGNCKSANAASAGPVWRVTGAATESKRIGDLPEIYAGSEGRAELQTTSADLSVGTGGPNDVVGHSVIVHSGLDPDPKAEFGVRNGWLACGVIERSEGLDLKNLL